MTEEVLPKSPLKRMKNPWVALVMICLSLAFTVKHAASLYFIDRGIIDPGPLEIALVCLAIAVFDSAIILLAIHGQRGASIVFSVAVFVINFLYFSRGTDLLWENWLTLAPGFTWSSGFAWLLFHYGELFISLNEEEDLLAKKSLRISELENDLGKKKTEAENFKAEAEKNKILLEKANSELEKSMSVIVKDQEAFKVYDAISNKYQASLLILSKKIGEKERKLDTIRKNRDNYKKKANNPLSKDEKLKAMVLMDVYEMIYKNSKHFPDTEGKDELKTLPKRRSVST